MDKLQWFTKDELDGKCAFYIGDYSEYAVNSKMHFWYVTLDQENFYGPFRTKKKAETFFKGLA